MKKKKTRSEIGVEERKDIMMPLATFNGNSNGTLTDFRIQTK